MANSNYLYLSFIALFTIGCQIGGDLKIIEFPNHIKTYTITKEAAENKYLVPTNFYFTVPKNLTIKNDKLIILCELQNDGKEFYLIVNPYGGEFPYGGTNPFKVSFSQSNKEIIKYVGAFFPPEPPLPMEIVVPAKSKISFSTGIPLDLYSWEGTPEVLLDWTFHYFKEPYPKGTIKVVLPKK